MARFVQSQFAKHPVWGAMLVTFRWLLWTVMAHPAGFVGALLVLMVGGFWFVGAALVVWALLEGALDFRGPVWYRSWSLGCRFARCWPSLWSAIGKDAVKVSKSDPGVAVGRLVCSCPWISMVPNVSGSVVSWQVRAQKGKTLEPLKDAVEAIAASSRRIHDVEVAYGRATASKGILSVSFGDVLADVEAPKWG